MATTIILSLVMMAGFFLLLYGAVALIQDKRLFTSAPKEIQAAVQPKAERFPGAHLLGWVLCVAALFLMGGAMIFGAWHGIRNGFAFGAFLVRFLVMLLGLKAFDILVFDWVLLCHSGFFARYYPEVKPLLGPQLFGFNWKSHLLTGTLYVLGSVALAYFCALL